MSSVQRAAADPTTAVPGVATRIDTSFARLYGLELVAGEGFKNVSNPPSEREPGLLISNETAVRAVGFATPEEALNQVVNVAGGGRIVGVFKDFHWSSAHHARENVFFYLARGNRQVSLKVSTEDLPQTIAAFEELYKRRFPGNPFRYGFADEQFDQQYRSDERFAALFSLFAGLAMAIACLGLFGLASFTAQRRTKEIGVRKVLGASVGGIVALLSKDFLKLVGVAFGVGAPVAYVAVEQWLTDYPNRIELGPGMFLMAGTATLLIALLTVGYQSIKAALADPVKSLRYE
jgi:putative ABC transport system permease protein